MFLVENNNKVPLRPLLHLVAAGLGIVCVTLVSVMIALAMHCKSTCFPGLSRHWKVSKTVTVSSLTAVNTVISEQHRENSNLTAQNLQLWTKNADLERQREELTREKDRLNWTMGVILEYENFPVNTHCPQQGENVVYFRLQGFLLFIY